MNRLLLFLSFLSFSFSFAQEFVLIKFKDKPSSSHYFSNPTDMLSQKSLDRRAKYAIPLTENDVPVESDYINGIKNIGITPVAISKWFNGIFAEINDSQVPQIVALNYVLGIESMKKRPNARSSSSTAKISSLPQSYQSSATEYQLEQIGLNQLHNSGYTGKGTTIAVIDAGFPGVDTIPEFAYLRNNNQIKGGYNYTNNSSAFYTGNSHGTYVLSALGAYDPGKYTGAAFDADYYLFITEKDGMEIPQEETWWIAAAEKSDSLGVDIINSSLGYTEFTDPRYSYTHNDLDGKTAFISKGAQIATEKGIMVVVAAGNDGALPWKRIGVPADAKDVLAVGSVNQYGVSSAFSSFGPSSDGRIKPDVCALGENTYLVGSSGIFQGSGTSFASPIIAGAVACLLQAMPNSLPSLLNQKIKESASLYSSPDTKMGYGIPNFHTVLSLLSTEDIISSPESNLSVYPNPVSDVLNVKLYSQKTGNTTVHFFDYSGRIIYKKEITLFSRENKISIQLPFFIRQYSNLILKIQTPDGEVLSKKISLL